MVEVGRERRQRWVEQKLAAVPGLTPGHRRSLSVPLMESGWHLLVAQTTPFPPRGRAAAFAVGRTGVYAFVFAEEIPGEPVLRSIRKHAEETFANLEFGRNQFVPHMVQVVLLMPEAGGQVDYRYLVADDSTIRATLLTGSATIKSKRARLLATAAAERASGYSLITADDVPVSEIPAADGLFTDGELREHERDRMLGRPFHDWMVFLDPDQLALVQRNFNGPARFSGPAGTGKTVVALHRMAHFAKRNPGRLLFTSFVKTLPNYHRSGFERLAPHVGGRAEFTGLHAWALRFLRERDAMPDIDSAVIKNAFSHAWLKARTPLAAITGTDNEYWKDELERVIKGRGITTLQEYQKINRAGRNRIRLDDGQREKVWENIYQPYQKWLADRDVHDFNDVIRAAVDELHDRPLDEPYGLVVVDEVQDFTLMELKLVHQIAGGRTDSQLLFVGDGQQQVYPGGWTLSDAGIPIVGRGAVLKTNYRNRAAVHEYAKSVDATNIVDDLDGGPGFVLRDTDVVLPDGQAEVCTGRRKDIEAKLVAAVREASATMTDIAVLSTTQAEATRLRDALGKAGVSTLSLTVHDGTRHDVVKVGTVHRAKGMDFAAVFHIMTRTATPISKLGGAERDRAELAGRQTMVALTRARDYIWVGIVED
ncbi:UvrD-helicase domain-containing protein [Nocardia australiensis]|uniref:UvrD-helicase domain-containing protein n=1 Tax=Nocardia australiensis TaxID=2887191 RepID=UPI001D14D693|nr:UvrD-helicase domain-containing protein [Nocardia australiensis]